MRKYLIVFGIMLLFVAEALATHNRAGEITYRHISGNTYEITITTYTKTSVLADREWLNISWGDNLDPDAPLDSIRRDSIYFSPTQDYQINFYTDTHTYPGPGIYVISMEDPNRNEGVNNIPESVVVPFYIQSTLTISALGHNNSAQLLNPAIGDACYDNIWYHNPGAFDPDGDSLVYRLVPCRGLNGQFAPGFLSPEVYTENTSDTFTIDPVTGDVVWDAPQLPAGEYNFALIVEEYRGGFLVGSVTRDMQITVIICDNEAPEFEAIRDTCIEAGQNLQFTVEVEDPDGDNFTLEAIGGPVTEVEHTANFNTTTGVFSWTPECEEVRQAPYEVLFKAEDFGNQIPLIGIETMFITVVAPAVQNPTAEGIANSIELNWDINACTGLTGPAAQGKYKIYRKIGDYGFEPSNCELGVPAYTGYTLLTELDDLNTSFYLDENNINFGTTYCYMVVTCLPDGSISYASEEFCANVEKEAPVMTNVDVVSTSVTEGENYVAWSPPSAIDTTEFQGPYYYELYFNDNDLPVYTTPQSDFLFETDTTFNHIGIDTESMENSYYVVFHNSAQPIFSNPATSVFLELEPNDNQLTLSWDEQVPWTNTIYEVFMEDDGGVMQSIGFSASQDTTITDLINNQEYCFMVISTGTFGGQDIIDPVVNRSQRICGKPVDLTPPCPPVLVADADCETSTVSLSWTNPNMSCADDVTEYVLYYAPFQGQELQPLASFSSGTASDTTFTFNLDGDLNSIAGCFAVTALDSLLLGPFGMNQNESEFSNIVCTDNCPLYFLPNVFSPNNDGVNDFYVPLENKYVESVDCKIFNRWGSPVFITDDPQINWDGSSDDSGEPVSDGVYYYTITANTIRLEGLVPVKFTGTITVIDSNNQNLIKE